MKKKWKIVLFVLCMLLLAPGCGSPKENADKNAATEKSVEEEEKKNQAFTEKELAIDGADSAREDENKSKDGKKAQSDTKKNKRENAQNSGKAEGENDILTGDSSSSSAVSHKEAAQKSGGTTKGKTVSRHTGTKGPSKGSGGAQKSSQNTSAKTDKPEKKSITVTISVDCKTAMEKGNSVAEAISSAGTVFGTRSITLKKDATVYDALRKTGLVIGASTSGMGVYVYSIQSLAENACGPGSGWLYSVNGKFHQTSCSSYKLKDGDKIQWRYTCDNGKDM